ncbi:MAG: ATP-binding cassette domain-containing protein [Candidatus Delongbacteria bacterium]|jgi:ABC-type multidrug transport system ATPase subunit|nr:ATP-binding cassette domain-containing protein [Candidatus Delongbacteria bacterium]
MVNSKILAQKYHEYIENKIKPDKQTIRNIENSRLIYFTKLFAVVASVEKELTETEYAYVLEFYWVNYPDMIAFYLFEKFEEFKKSYVSLQSYDIDKDIGTSYGEKIFILFKIYEFIYLLGKVSDSKLKTGRKIASLLGINNEELNLVESIFNGNFKYSDTYKNINIRYILISDDERNSDVYLPYGSLKLIVFNLEKFYFLIKLDENSAVQINKFNVQQKITFKMPYGSNLTVNDYTIGSEDIKLYLKIKYNIYPNKYFFLNDINEQIDLVKIKDSTSIAKLDFIGSKIILETIDKKTIISVNDVENENKTYVNINDFVKINGSYLNIRKLKYQEFFENEYIRFTEGKTEYEISNYSGSDIYISDKSEIKWNGKIILKNGNYFLNTGTCYHPVWIIRNNEDFQINKQTTFLGRKIKQEKLFELNDNDIIFIQGNVLKFNLEGKLFEKTYFRYITYRAKNLEYYFADNEKAIDSVSFEADHGDLTCIMGPSGAGKTTLLKILSGKIKPQSGKIYADNFNLFEYYEKIKRFISYVPQDDVIFENLTVFENFYYNAQLRYPKLSRKNLSEKVDSVIKEISLTTKRDTRVGTEFDKILSSGERKRINIGLELLSNSNIYFFDEPTSGLSSKDSEKVIELLSKLSKNGKIIFTIIHQPSYKIYNKFNKIILLDNGGKLAYYGNTQNALEYFKDTSDKFDTDIENIDNNRIDPDLLLDSLEEPLRDIDGSIIPERKFSPDHWKEKYLDHLKELKSVKIPAGNLVNDVPSRNFDLEGKIKQFFTLLTRNFKNKLRNKSNILITFLEAPILAFIVGFILRYVPVDKYTLYNNIHMPIFLFLTVIITIFLSMVNSSDEIIKDMEVLEREKMLDVKYKRYFISKFLTQLFFATIQNILYLAVSFSLLEIRELFFEYLVFMTIISISGISLGFFISSIPGLTVKAVQNIVPLILIPQIIFGGALIQYKELNTSLTINQNSPIPEICQFMPSRWAYEGLMVLQDSYNSYHPKKDAHQRKLDEMIKNKSKHKNKEDIELYKERKYDLLNNEMVSIRKKYMSNYGNREIHRAIVSGNEKYEQLGHKSFYPMFSSEKVLPIVDKNVNTSIYNAFVLFFISLLINSLTFIMLSNRKRLIKIFTRKRKA